MRLRGVPDRMSICCQRPVSRPLWPTRITAGQPSGRIPSPKSSQNERVLSLLAMLDPTEILSASVDLVFSSQSPVSKQSKEPSGVLWQCSCRNPTA